MSPLSEMRLEMNPNILRFDDAEQLTTPGITSSMRDEPDDVVLQGPKFRGRSSSAERELLKNRFEIDEPRDPLTRG
ncbi:MAG: hypothetical protein O2955_05490 [Planctomycetota bacterium]|nr:hypothetical protein [Planctomycetota bacterium]MDA1211945.1 hypothetical protein [Planctomycetota bacterium]